jgi:signal transduction histidine kinase
METEKSSDLKNLIECAQNHLHHLPLGVFITDSSGQICYINPFLQDLWSFPESIEHLNLNILEDKSLKTWGSENSFKKALVKGEGFAGERLKFVSPGRTPLFLSLKVASLRNNQDSIFGLLCFVIDETEKVKLEKDLKEKIYQFSVINQAGNAFCGTMKTERILEIILTGVTCGQGLGFNRAFLLLLNEGKNLLEGRIAVGPSNHSEAQKIWNELSSKEQTLEEALKSYQDVSQEKDILVNQIVKSLKIPLENEQNIVAQAVKQRRSINLQNGFPVTGGFGQTTAREKPFDPLFELLEVDSLAIVPIIAREKVLGVILADNLITGKKIEEEDVKFLQIFANHASSAIENSKLYESLELQIKKLEELNRNLTENTRRMIRFEKLSVMGQITSKVAHQLRNPLTVIGGFAKSIFRKMTPEDPNYNYIKIIAEESERVETILDQVLNYTPSSIVNLSQADLIQTLEHAINSIKEKIDPESIRIEKHFPQNFPKVSLDPEQFSHALINIMRNGISAMPEGGLLKIDAFEREGGIEIKISDTGIGILEKDLKHIFDPFFTTKEKSNGLGLTVASEIIKSHGGEIKVESHEKQGSTFSIFIPLNPGVKYENHLNSR